MIILRNPGEIDLDVIKIMGVNVKDCESPIGHFGPIFERRHGVICSGEVLDNDGYQRVKIRSKTGKEYWISAFSIQEPKSHE